MKSLLVDALRQASGTAEPAADETPADSMPPASNEPVATPPSVELQGEADMSSGEARDDDLELIESTVLPTSVARTAAIESGRGTDSIPEQSAPAANLQSPPHAPLDHAPESAEPEHGNGGRHAVDADVVDPTVLLPSLDPQRLARPEPSPAVAEAMPPRKDRLVALARWSPVLCLLAMSAAAGSLAFYQKLSAKNLNIDLNGLPQQTGSDIADPAGMPGWQVLAETNESGGELSGAATVRERQPVPAPERNPNENVTGPRGANLPQTVTVVPQAMSDPAFDAVLDAYDAYSRGNFPVAEQRYRLVLQDYPNHYDALTGLAAILQRTARIAEALDVYTQIIASRPNDTAAAASLAAFADYDQSVDAATRINVLLQQQPQAAALHFALGLVMAGENRWPEARDAFLAASTLMPANADYSYNVAVSAQRLGQTNLARSYYSMALQQLSDTSLVERQTILAQLNLLSESKGESS